MTVSLIEASSISATKSKNRWRVKVIQSGWGSSGYYPAEMLAEYGPKVFAKGTKVFMNHPSVVESNDRPERDVHQLAGKLISNAKFVEGALFADVEFYSHYAPIIEEMADDVGLSIRASGNAKVGEAEGRQGPIIESLVEDPLTSVDVVTVAGAGGKFISLLESYKLIDSFIEESVMEGNSMSITKEEFEAAIADLKTTLVESFSPLMEQVSVLVEAATPAETIDEVEDAAEAVDPIDVAEKFNESGLPSIALKRVAESLKSESNTKTVDELLEAEKAYATSLREAIAVPTAATAEVVGIVHEAEKTSVSTTPLADQFANVVNSITGKK
jgi:hypothetical protein